MHELTGEKALNKSIQELTDANRGLADWFQKTHPNKRYFYARIGDRATESGYREVEMRIENDGSISLNVNMADLNNKRNDFAVSIQSTYTRDKDSDKGLTSITFGGEVADDRKTITANRDASGQVLLKNTTLGTGITAQDLALAADDVSKLSKRFKTASGDGFDELRMENTLPKVDAIGSGGNDRPEAPWN